MHRDYAGDFNKAFDELTKPFRQEKREKARGKKEQETGKPNLVISDNEDAMLRNAFKILEADTLLYRKDGRLVTPTIDKKNDRRKSRNDIFFALTACDSSFVRQRLAELSTPCKEVFNAKTKDFMMQPCRIPDLIPKVIIATAMNGELNPLPRIDGILHGPVINENGALVNSRGLVEISGLNFYQAGDIPDFNLPETITREDAEEAGRQLLNLLVDYEFESKEYDPAKWLAMVLTQLARPLVEYSPFFILTANTSRAGKTLLVDALGLICHGNHPQRLAWPTRSDRREDELAKTVSGYAFEGKTLCFWDNLQDGSSLISEKLCQDLTAAYIHNRMLHSNTMIGGRNLLQFIASGNNISPSGDLIGRSIVVKVFSSNAAPGNRDPKKFIHGRLDSHIKKNRLPILRNALMILAGYIRAGRPDMPGAHLAGFDDWVSLVCGSIRWAVGIDPIEDQQKTAMEADPQTQGLIALALNWGQVFGDIPQKAGAIYRKLAGAMDAEDNTPALALLEALETLYGGACIKNQNQIPLILKRFLGKRIRCNDRVYILDGKLDSKNGGLIYSMRTE